MKIPSNIAIRLNVLCGTGMHQLTWTAARSKQLRVIFIAFTMVLLCSLSAQTKPQRSSQGATSVRVPFVGCNSDGQQGPLPAPKGAKKAVQINARAGKGLAYYQA